MAKVRITTPDKMAWQTSGLRQTEQQLALLPDGGPASGYKLREPGSAQDPQLVELRYHPGEVIELHCHDEPEILYILGGSMQINNRTLEPGATLFIDGGVFYGFTAGPEGLHFLNFRARSDSSFHLPDRRQFIDAGTAA
jgi:hypothetical protein